MAGGILSKILSWLGGGKGASRLESTDQQEAQDTTTRAQERLNKASGASGQKSDPVAENGVTEAQGSTQSIVETMTTHASGAAAEIVEKVEDNVEEVIETVQQTISSSSEIGIDDVSQAGVEAESIQQDNNGTISDIESKEDYMSNVSMNVNGSSVSGDVEDRTLLVSFLRDQLRLTGTHVGCDTSQCGACVVHVDGKAVKSCTMLAVQADGSDVTTIEGLADGSDLHPVQTAFKAHHGLQCGFCTPGMIMSAVDMIERYKTAGKTLDEAAIRAELEGNICRCTGYHNIVKSIQAAADASA